MVYLQVLGGQVYAQGRDQDGRGERGDVPARGRRGGKSTYDRRLPQPMKASRQDAMPRVSTGSQPITLHTC
jgi:hypothetical protein